MRPTISIKFETRRRFRAQRVDVTVKFHENSFDDASNNQCMLRTIIEYFYGGNVEIEKKGHATPRNERIVLEKWAKSTNVGKMHYRLIILLRNVNKLA